MQTFEFNWYVLVPGYPTDKELERAQRKKCSFANNCLN